MDFGDKVKDIYFSAEEKWYGLLDKVDAHIPIYKVVDKVDQVVPSFALFIIIVIILLLLLGIGIFGIAGIGGEVVLQLSVVDNSGNGVSGAQITLEGINDTYYSNEFGLVEDISLLAVNYANVTVTKGDKTKNQKIFLNDNPTIQEIQLPVDVIRFDSRTALFLTETGQRINDKINLSYRCSSGTGAPQDDTIYDGSANINVSNECGILSITITSDKYNIITKTITQAAETFYLTEKIPARIVTAIIQLKYNGTLITDPVSVKAFRMNNLYLPEDTVVSANGSATFNLQEGNYKFSTITEYGYTTASISNVALTPGMSPIVIDLIQSVIGKINVTTKRGSITMSDVLVTLRKGATEIEYGDTNDDGQIDFEVADTGPYILTANKEGYCGKTVSNVDVGDNVEIKLETDTGNCGGTLQVKVIDQDNKPVQYARAIIFGETEEDSYKLGYTDKLTDYNGKAKWEPVKYTDTTEKYRVFAFKGSYTGWSTLREFTLIDEGEAFTVKLDIPLGTVNVIVKDKDGDPLSFSDQEPVYVRLYEDFGNNPVSGKKIIENADGTISFITKAGRRVYAVVEKEGYQSHMTLPKDVIGDGTITYEVVLTRPPIDEVYVNFLGLYKNGSQALKVEAGQEYDAMFELIAPKDYEELGMFVRVGRDDYTKTELDKIYIDNIVAPGAKDIIKGATYNPPKGYSTDTKYLNQDESKWAQVIWQQNGFVQGRIMVSAKVKIRDNAQVEELLTITYRAWGIYEGSYERDIKDDILGTSASNSTKQELYAATKEAYATVGMETLCEESGQRAFCITSTYTDTDGLINSFDTTFDAKNNSQYNLFIKVLNASNVGFDIAKTKLENDEENLYLGNYSLYTPTNQLKNGSINGNSSDWIETNNYTKNSSITFNELKVTPSSTGYGSLLLRIRDERTILFEKTFGINISSSKKMRTEYMYNSEFQDTIPKIVSGKVQTLTVKALNNANGLEIEGAMVKLYDRFGTKLAEKQTNKLGTVSIEIPGSLPGEKLVLKIEKTEYETYVEEFNISEDIVDVDPTTLGFTVNPQTKPSDTKTVKVENKTGFDLMIKEITLDGKFKGKLDKSQIESWLYGYTGTTIASDDYEEIDLKIISASSVKAADDLTGTFTITVTNGYTEWVKEIDATIRVGLGKDVDNPNCLEITNNSWIDSTQGEQISVGFEIINNCAVDGTTVPLKNLAAKDVATGNILGTFSVQSDESYTEVSRGFARTFQPNIDAEEVVPITLNFIPDGGVNGQTSGTIVFQAINETDSKDQVLETSIAYTIEAINLDDCITLGADLIRMTEEETGSFSVTNNCPVDVYFEIETELMTSDDKFTLSSSETKEVSLTGEEGEAGAFNTLVYAREGSSPMELIDNVKTIIDPAGGCFSLSRYEFDIYDATDNDYDGEDTALLKNSCTEKNTTTQVEGTEEYDYDNLWQAAVLGALAGWVGCDGAWNDLSCISGKLGNNSKKTERVGNATDEPTRSSGNQSTVPTLDRATINAEKEMKDRAARESAKLISQSNTNRGPENLIKETITLKDETIAALNLQKERIYQDKALISIIGSGIKNGTITATRSVGKFFSGGWGIVSTLWKDESLTTTQTEEQKVSTTQDVMVEKIDERIEKINAIYLAIETAKTKFDQAIIEANNEMQSKLTKQGQNILEQRRAGTIGEEKKVGDYFKATNNENAEFLAGEYAKAAKVFNASVKLELDKFMSEINGNLENLGSFEEYIVQEQNKLNTATTTAQTAAGFDSVLTTQQIAKNKATLTTTYETQKTELESSIAHLEQKIEKINNEIKALNREVVDAESLRVQLLKAGGDVAKIDQLREQIGKNKDKEGEIATATALLKGGIVTGEDGKEQDYVGAEEELETKEQEFKDLETAHGEKIKLYDAALSATSTAEDKAKKYTGIMKIIILEEKKKMEDFKVRLQGIISKPADETAKRRINADLAAQPDVQSKTNDPIENSSETVTVTGLDAPVNAGFLLATSTNNTRAGSSTATSQSSGNSSSGILNSYTTQIMGIFASWNSGSALSGALIGALMELTQASDTLIDESYTFIVDYVNVNSVTLNSADGVGMSIGETTYDYDDYYTSTSGGEGYNISSESLATNYQLVEETELTFSNPSGLISDTPYQPFEGILTVTASENVYDDEYDYEDIRTAAIERGEYEENDSAWYEFWDVSETEIADMEEEDLVVDEVRTITKNFHLLFNSYEYTTTIDPEVIGNCQVGAKNGSTGPNAVPKILLDWEWSNIDTDTCDETNPDYVYCDTTQMTTTLLKKIYGLKQFFKTNTLPNCPQAIDVSGTRTQTLSETDLDVGITQIQAKEISNGAQLEIVVQTNNNLPMDIDLDVKIYETETTNVVDECNQTQNITTIGTYTCDVDSSLGGTYDVVATITPTLCTGCENNSSGNDTINSQLVIGQSGTQDCLYYKTTKDYFEDVLAANNKLNATIPSSSDKVIDYLNFTINLVRDGFSKDFKRDFTDYLNQLTEKPTAFTDIEDLFNSDKVTVTWSGKPGAWDAGKYNARIVIEFEEDSWNWLDNNSIKSVEIILSGWGEPDKDQAIYDIAFDGTVGMGTDNGRLGYGVNYTQLSENALKINDIVEATPDPYNNALTEVNVDVDKGFYAMNTSRRGNVLTIKRSGNKVNLIMSPSTAVPLLLDISRTSARDAYAYYTVEVDGQVQTTGSSLITWKGIGNGCVDFAGSGMGTWDNAPDMRESGGNGYGFLWTNAVAQGTASFYGTFYAPDNTSTAIYFTRQSEDAVFTSSGGSGDLITVDTSSGISTLKDVLDGVADDSICVIGGEYFWNSEKVYAPIEAAITSRSNTCMTIN